MDIVEDVVEAQYNITSFTKNEVFINRLSYQQSLIISPNLLTQDWPVSHVSELNDHTLGIVTSHNADVVLIGCHSFSTEVRRQLMRFFSGGAAGFELMTTDAVCRTYNILAAENRRVAAAIILENNV